MRVEGEGVETELIRLVDPDIKPGVQSDEGDGDEWPGGASGILASEMTYRGHADLGGPPVERGPAHDRAHGRMLAN